MGLLALFSGLTLGFFSLDKDYLAERQGRQEYYEFC